MAADEDRAPLSVPRHIGYLAPTFVAEDELGLGGYIALMAKQRGINLKSLGGSDGYRVEVRLVREGDWYGVMPEPDPVRPEPVTKPFRDHGREIVAGLRAGLGEDVESLTLKIEFKVPGVPLLPSAFWEEFQKGIRAKGGDPRIVTKKRPEQ